MEMATPEVISALVQTSIADEVRQESHRFLERCDLVKFAKYRPLPEDASGLLPAARSLVDRTRHVPEEAARSPAGVEEFASP